MEETISRMAGAGWGIQIDAEGVRRRDPRARAAHHGVRTTTYDRIETESRSAKGRIRQVTLTVMVIPIDDRVSSPKGLHSRFPLGDDYN